VAARFEKPKTWVRDVWSPRQVGEYATPRQALEEVKEWYWRSDEQRGAEPSGYAVVERTPDGEWQTLILQNLRDEFCVGVRFRGSDDAAMDIETFPIRPELAYQIALDRDEALLARGYTLVNERHPRQ
jgi:hypothetical protein